MTNPNDLNKHRKKILNLTKNGKSVEEIAKVVGVDHETMLDWFRGELLFTTASELPPSKFEIEKRAEFILERRAKGMAIQAIADELGMSAIGLSAWCKKHGVTLPRLRKQ